MIFELTVLGSGSALPTSTKFTSAHVLNAHERFFLIDCGEGTQMQLRRSKTGFRKLNHILISHLHGDHLFGIFGLLSSFQLLNRKTPLNIYGPEGIQEVITFFTKNFAEDLPYDINLHILKKRIPQLIFEDKVIEVSAFPLKHRILTFGYKIQEKLRPLNIKKEAIEKYKPGIKQIHAIKSGEDLLLEDGKIIPNMDITEPPYKCRSFAYCSDTMMYEKNIEFLKGTDLLYHEATFLHQDKNLAKQTGHSTANQAATFAKRAKIGKLIIGHFSSRYKNPDLLLNEAREIFEETYIAEELQKYTVKLTR